MVKRQSHRNRNKDDENNCECGSDEDDIFELEDLNRRLRRLKHQLQDYLNRIRRELDQRSTKDNEQDFQYVGLDIIMNENIGDNAELQEMRALKQRINYLEQHRHKRKHKRASNPHEESAHQARVFMHQARSHLQASDQEWQRILDDLEDDMETDEKNIKNQQAINSNSNHDLVNIEETDHSKAAEEQRTHITDEKLALDRDVKVRSYLSSFGSSDLDIVLDYNDIIGEKHTKSIFAPKRQRIVIVFLTSSSTNTELTTMKKWLNHTADCVIIFDNAPDCFEYLRTTKDSVIALIITDDYANNQNILGMLNELPSVSHIYRWIDTEDPQSTISTNEFTDACPKLQGSFTEINPLCQRINSILPVVHDTFNVFSPNDTERSLRDLKLEDIIFVWYQIVIDFIQSLPETAETRADFLVECRQQCFMNKYQQADIDEFERDYQSTKACNWYTKDSCLYKIVNEALRKQNVRSIYSLRLFIKDLSLQLMKNRDMDKNLITLYRGQRIGIEEIGKLLQGKDGGLIAFNTFLSTSRNKLVATMYGGDGSSLGLKTQSFLIIEIEAMSNMCYSVTDCSAFPDEDEYLFMIGTIFKILSFDRTSESSYYAKLRYVKDTDRIGLNVVKKQLEHRISIYQGPTDLTWGRFLYYTGEYDAAKEYYEKLLDRLVDERSEEAITIYNDLAQVYFHLGRFAEASDFQKHAVDLALNSSASLNLSILLENYGSILLKLGYHDRALHTFREALRINKTRQPQDIQQIARIYSNIGTIYSSMHQYLPALEYFRYAFKIQRRITLANSADLAATCNNIGIVYTNLSKHKLAHKYYSEAFSIALRSLPCNHPSVQLYLRNRNAYLKATPTHDNKKASLKKIPSLYRQDSDESIPSIEITLDQTKF